MSWPPTLAALKVDLKIDPGDTRDDVTLQSELDSAVAIVARVRKGAFQFDPTDPAQFTLIAPTADITLGTLRLAGRWHARRRSPEGLVDLGDLGASRVPGSDPDIDRLLGIGRFRGPVFA